MIRLVETAKSHPVVNVEIDNASEIYKYYKKKQIRLATVCRPIRMREN